VWVAVGIVSLVGSARAADSEPKPPGLQARSGICRAASGVRRGRRSLASRPIPWLRGNLPNVQAQGALVVDLEEGEELFSRRADEPRAIASISKLAATLTVVERGLTLDGLTTMGRIDAEVARGGAHSRLADGLTLSNRDLLHAALLGSDNRAISALGRAVGLDARALAAAMTDTARRLGLRETRFVEPTGVSPLNRSTPRETIGLLRAVMDHPVLGPITRTMVYEVRPLGRRPIHYVNTHRPASRANTLVLGGKTGFNNAARYCLVLAAKVGGRTLGMAFLGTEGQLTRFGDVARVSDWVVARRARRVVALPRPQATSGASAPAPVVPENAVLLVDDNGVLPPSQDLEPAPAPVEDVPVEQAPAEGAPSEGSDIPGLVPDRIPEQFPDDVR
jgi:serine-type D-Ala-D-Ala endopeptidase (penicillin-binding protein 7)